MFKLTVLASMVAAHLVPKALEGSWDARSDGQHVADVHVQGDRASFDDGDGAGNSYEYKIRAKNGLLEMNGWIARADSKPDTILWHKGQEEVMWRRSVARKLRGGKTLEQSRSGLSRTKLPIDGSASSPFSDLLAASEAAREHTASLHEVEGSAEGQDSAIVQHSNSTDAIGSTEEVTQQAAEQHIEETKVRPAESVEKKVVRRSKLDQAPRHVLNQYLTDKYITAIKAAQKIEMNETRALKQGEQQKGVKAHKPRQRRKVFPAAMHSLAELMTNTQKGIDENAFDDVIEMVRQIIRDEAAATCTEIEGDLQGLVDTMDQCSADVYTSGGEGLSGAYDTADSEYVTAVGEYDSAYAAENATCTEKDTVCTNRDAKGLELYNEVTGSQDCQLPGTPDDTVAYDDSFVLASVDTWANTLITKHTAWDTAKVACTEKEQECSDAETVTAEKETEKMSKCTALSTAASDGLGAYDGCWNTADGAYMGYDPTTTLDSIKNSIDAIETLMCYIDAAMEGLAKPKDEREQTGGDSTLTCEMDNATSEYVCTCTDAGGDRYTESYNLAVNEPTPPDRDGSWDELGCPEATDDDGAKMFIQSHV